MVLWTESIRIHQQHSPHKAQRGPGGAVHGSSARSTANLRIQEVFQPYLNFR